jgi:hypothetical protein
MNTAIDMQGNNLNNGGTVTGNRVQTADGSTLSPAYDMAGSKIAAQNSIYSYGTICSQNSAGDCSGTGGTVINGGAVSAGTVTVPAGNNLKVGGSSYYGDGANSAVRQNGGLYVQHYDGSSADMPQVGNINASGTVTGQMFIPTNAYTANSFCWWPGAMATEAGTGRSLTCQSNGSSYAWRRAGAIATAYVGAVTGNAPRDVGWHKFCVLNGIGDPQVTGTTIILVPTAGPNAEGYWFWQVQMNAYNGAGTAVVACFDDA